MLERCVQEWVAVLEGFLAGGSAEVSPTGRPLARSPSQGKTPQETLQATQMLLKKGLGGVLGGWEGPLVGFRGQVGTPMGQDDAKLAPRFREARSSRFFGL